MTPDPTGGRPLNEYSVEVSKGSFVFCAAHFITYGDGQCEPLHGHNYGVSVRIAGELNDDALVHDFLDLKARMERLTAELDHRTLLPDSNPRLEVERGDGEVTVRHEDRLYRFPRDDVVMLPVPNTTAEMLAAYLADALVRELEEEGATGGLHRVAVEVEEAPGQVGRHSRDLTGSGEE